MEWQWLWPVLRYYPKVTKSLSQGSRDSKLGSPKMKQKSHDCEVKSLSHGVVTTREGNWPDQQGHQLHHIHSCSTTWDADSHSASQEPPPNFMEP